MTDENKYDVISYVTYRKADGMILSTGACPREALQFQTGHGEGLIETDRQYPGNAYQVIDGLLVKRDVPLVLPMYRPSN